MKQQPRMQLQLQQCRAGTNLQGSFPLAGTENWTRVQLDGSQRKAAGGRPVASS